LTSKGGREGGREGRRGKRKKVCLLLLYLSHSLPPSLRLAGNCDVIGVNLYPFFSSPHNDGEAWQLANQPIGTFSQGKREEGERGRGGGCRRENPSPLYFTFNGVRRNKVVKSIFFL
jgi:hypothetical protein